MAFVGGGDLVGRVLAGRYRLLTPIGTGGSGRVFLADDLTLKRRVAVKVLHPALADDPGFLRRFQNEARLAAALHHPNVMAVHDWGEDGGVPFMVMEALTGGSLRGILDAGGRLSPAQAAHVGAQVASALEYAHGRGFVHRDIKPANLLFDEHGIVRVADFGLARALAEASWTEPSGSVLGTARYASPEQASGVALDGRADLYALALCLVEAVTGVLPFASDTALGTLAARTLNPIEAPAALGPLVAVVERAGRVHPEDRYPDAATMRGAIEDAGRRLPPPGPLGLAGLDASIADPNPTQIPASRPVLFDQEADAAPGPAPGPAPRRRVRISMSMVVGAAIAAALIGAVALIGVPDLGAQVTVPNTVGGTVASARDAIARAGLLVQEDERFSDDPAGTVIAQEPSPGHEVREGGEIRLVVSRGAAPIAIPRVAGRPLTEAQTTLTDAGFTVEVQRRYDEERPKDTVIATRPAGRAPRFSTVTLVVSDGRRPIPIPDVAGQSYDAAVAAIANAGFAPVRGDAFSDTVPSGTVIGTDPAGDGTAQPGAQVRIIVSKGPDVVTVPSVRGLSLDAASAALQAAGLNSAVSGAYRPGATVRATDPPAGTTVKRNATVTLFF
ncbi:MAG: PASTA domain-containing protein [Actinomycetes bacterium]